MPEKQEANLLYDPTPRPDVKTPPLSDHGERANDSRRLDSSEPKGDVSDLLANLSFS